MAGRPGQSGGSTPGHHTPAGKASLRLNTRITHALKDGNLVAAAMNKLTAEDSLLNFTDVVWDILEPGREFVKGWAIEAICDHLEAVTRGEIRKLLVNVPPGLMKSLSTNVLWPAWEWGPQNRPDLRYIGASYSQDLTIRDNRRCRQIIESPLYRALWGDRFHLVSDQNAKVRYDTDKRGFKIATSVEGMGTGERGDRFVIDDPHNVKRAESEADLESRLQWFTEVVPSRVNDLDRSAFVVIMQRVHERDISGHIIASELGYDHLMLPMEYEPSRKCYTRIGFEDPRTEEGELLFPERFSEQGIEELKHQLASWGGQYAISGQLQQSPVPRGGGMFKVDKEEIYARMKEVAPKGGEPIRGWDIAGSTRKRSPYTASVRMKMVGNTIYIENVTRERKEIEEAEEHILVTARTDGFGVIQDLPQDPGSAGKSQKRALAKKLEGLHFFITTETGSKEDRAVPFASQWNAGNVVLCKGDWNEPFLAELASFPRGEYKDQVDAASRAYSRLLARPDFVAPEGGEIIEVTEHDLPGEEPPAEYDDDDEEGQKLAGLW